MNEYEFDFTYEYEDQEYEKEMNFHIHVTISFDSDMEYSTERIEIYKDQVSEFTNDLYEIIDVTNPELIEDIENKVSEEAEKHMVEISEQGAA